MLETFVGFIPLLILLTLAMMVWLKLGGNPYQKK